MKSLHYRGNSKSSLHYFSILLCTTLLAISSLLTGCGQNGEIENIASSNSTPSQVSNPSTNNAIQKAGTTPVAQKAINPINKAWQMRAKEQASAVETAKTVHAFQFTDILSSSGILFEHKAVDDAGKYYKPVH